MTKSRPHMIRTQRVEVTFEDPKDAFECKSQLAAVCKSKLLPAMEKLFDQKSGQKQTISIDRLSIDAGPIDRENWENNFVETVLRQLSKYLDTDVIEKPHQKRASEDLYNIALPESGASAEGEGVVIREAGNETDVLLYFLQHGMLPWYDPRKSKQELLQQLGLAMADLNFIQSVRSLIEANDTVIERFIYHAKEDDVLALIDSKKSKRAELKELKKSWQAIFKMSNISLSKQLLAFFKAAFFVLVKENEKVKISKSISRRIAASLTRKELEQIIALKESEGNYRFTQEEIQVIRYVEERKAARKKNNKAEGQTSKEEKFATSNKRSIKIVMGEENPVFISNAGLVLLHPFLSGLFANVGYTEEEHWISEAVHQRSLLLSQYLVTGTDESVEPDLFLNKILTGYPQEESLPIEIELSAFEKEEAADLLQSVINHWKALKNTSVNGLRNTFLNREGKIVKNESGWLLQVEQQPFDILIDKIPWGFSTIKTPWMEELLSVEWA